MEIVTLLETKKFIKLTHEERIIRHREAVARDYIKHRAHKREKDRLSYISKKLNKKNEIPEILEIPL